MTQTTALPFSSRNGNFNLDACLNVDNDLLNHLGRSIQINQALVNPHLVRIPSLATFTAGRLTGRDPEVLGGQANGALDAEILGFGAVDQLRADFLK